MLEEHRTHFASPVAHGFWWRGGARLSGGFECDHSGLRLLRSKAPLTSMGISIGGPASPKWRNAVVSAGHCPLVIC